MIIQFCELEGVLELPLSNSFEDEFTKHGVKLCDWGESLGGKGDARTLVFLYPKIAFKVLAIYLFKQCYCPEDIVYNYSRSEAVKYFLSLYENFTEENRCQCDEFLISLLDKPNGQSKQEDLSQSAFTRFLNRIYNQLPAPLFSVMSDNLTESQTLFLIDSLAHQYPAADVNCKQRNIDMEEELSREIDKHNTSRQYSLSPLIYACFFIKSLAVIRFIIEKSPTLLNRLCLPKRDHSTIAPIHAAAMRGDVNVLQVLLDKGVDITLTNHLGETPLHLAQNPACVRLLINAGAGIHAVNCVGATALHAACDGPFEHRVERSLCEATKNKSEKIRLLIQAGADVNQQDNDGNTPLHYVVRSLFKGSFDNGLYTRMMIVALCENGANPNIFNSRPYSEKMPPLLYLYDNECINSPGGGYVFFDQRRLDGRPKGVCSELLLVAELLLHYGADPAVCSSKGESILHKLYKIHHPLAVMYFLNITSVKALVKDQKLANPNTFWEKPVPKTKQRQAKDDSVIVRRYG